MVLYVSQGVLLIAKKSWLGRFAAQKASEPTNEGLQQKKKTRHQSTQVKDIWNELKKSIDESKSYNRRGRIMCPTITRFLISCLSFFFHLF